VPINTANILSDTSNKLIGQKKKRWANKLWKSKKELLDKQFGKLNESIVTKFIREDFCENSVKSILFL
jgi:hypothetical protein